jgi:serine/threonine protein kinase
MSALRAGSRLGSYEIVSALGAGGMGEVYRARDVNLGRDVAIKVLPPAFSADSERIARFRREAHVLAALNHPHVAAIYGLEEVNGVTFLILELVDGETLDKRISRGPVNVGDALGIGKQIAEALESAHEKAIVHRDLKPSNIALTAQGQVKVLDFGLAKLAPEPATSHALSMSPTITSPALATGAGTILGTAAYMSPEQANGREADKRSDVWAFGCVLFEMLTGKPAFDGTTTAEVLSSVLKTDPNWTALPDGVPPTAHWLLRQCLQKEWRSRLRDTGDARLLLERSETEAPAVSGAAIRPARVRWLWAALVIALAVLAAAATWMWSRPPLPNELRLEVNAPPTTEPTSLAISPDGKTIVFVATSGGRPQLWLRQLAAVTARPLLGTENAGYPFWSPDSRSIGFSANDALKRIDLETGAVRLVSSGSALNAAWNQDDTILFDKGPGAVDGGLFRVSADGGKPQVVTQANTEASDHLSPQFLPDQRHFLFYGKGSAAGIYIGELGAAVAPHRLLEAQAATYVASGHLLFVRDNTLFAQRFDPARLELAGRPTAIAGQILVSGDLAAMSASEAGPIVYRTGPPTTPHQFVWFDRRGTRLDAIPGSDMGTGIHSSLSPDGNRLAISRTVGTSDIWLLDVRRGIPTRFTFHPATDLTPVWSPDGRKIAFTSNRRGATEFALYVRAVEGPGDDELLVAVGSITTSPTDWARDGRFLLYVVVGDGTGRDLWALPFQGDGKPFAVLQTRFNETSAQFSPDGRWIAYQSDASGRPEIYVQPFPGPARSVQVSGGGGVQPRWRDDGKELFYHAPDNRLMAASIDLNAKLERAEVGAPVPLFVTQVASAPQNASARQYMVSPDGQRFLIDTLTEVSIPITVIMNWGGIR